MLLDIITSYDESTKESLRNVRKGIILALEKEHDPRKILSFLNKCAVISIDEKDKLVYLGVPNAFVSQQVKKFFTKALIKAIRETYNEQFGLQLIPYQDLQEGDHELQLNLKTLLSIQEKPAPIMDTSVKSKLESYFGILFESKYTLNNFVVGATNELAYSAAEAIAKEPGTVYNPFFIYGNVGLGKTHLMQAIGNQIMETFPEKTVLYLPTTRFIDEVIKAIRNNKMSALQEKLEHVDVLMLDDIQFLAGKDKTQEIFHNIFNDFHSKNKQIVVTSDQPPKSLTLLESRLQSRFALGLVADIKPPDTETRAAILEAKLKKKGESLDSEFIDLIAKIVHTNVRELEGALNIVLTKKKLRQGNLTMQDIEESLETLGFEASVDTPSSGVGENFSYNEKLSGGLGARTSQTSRLEQIIQKISLHYGVAARDIIGTSRKKEVSFTRQMSMYIAKQHFNWSLQKIGNFFGGRNHASVIYAIRQFEEKMKENKELEKDMRQFM